MCFTVGSQGTLEKLLSMLPFIGPKIFVVRNQLQTQAVFIDVSLNGEGRIWYRLILSGSPQYIQRRLIESVEKALTSGLDRLGAKRLSCPKYAFVRNADTPHDCGP